MTLLAAIGDLEEAARTGDHHASERVLTLRDLRGLTIVWLAQRLDITREALKSRLHRARALAREYLDP